MKREGRHKMDRTGTCDNERQNSHKYKKKRHKGTGKKIGGKQNTFLML